MCSAACRTVLALCLLRSAVFASGTETYRLRGRSVTSYPHDIPPEVKRIVIDLTKIAHVDYVEQFPNLTYYQLSNNLVTEFPNLVNVSQTLTSLMVTSTQIATLPVDVMPTMPKLRYVDISHNWISHVPDLTGVFPVLSTLSAYSNQVTTMVRSTARTLYLRNNRMASVPDLSNVADRFRSLGMAGNVLETIPDGALPPMPDCERLDFGGNALMAFPDLTNVSRLEELNLSANQLAALPPSLPRLTELRKLLLADNNLTAFPDLTNFSRSLTSLQLSGNEIESIPERLLGALSSLDELTLGRRSAAPIPLPNFCLLDSSRTLSVTIHDSDVVCDRNAAFAKWRQLSGSLEIHFSGDSSASCHSPGRLSGRPFAQLTVDEILKSEPGMTLTSYKDNGFLCDS